MDTFQKKTVRELALAMDRDCVSIFMPIVRGEDVGQQNAIRLKNLLAAVEEQLIERGWRTTVAREFVQAVREPTEKAGYWEDGSQGLAIFGSERRLALYRLPIATPELSTVGECFHITPLLGAEDDVEFFILAVNQKSCRVVRGHRWGMEEVKVPGLPANMAEVLGPTEPLFAHEAHGAGRHGNQRATIFTGQGGASDFVKADIEEYFRAIDRALTKYLEPGNRPVVLAGVHSVLPLYRAVSRYAGLMEQTIDGNPDLISGEELHRRAWAVVEPRLQADRQRVLRACQAGESSGRASCDLAAILAAAHEGRVESLVVAPNTCCWGRYQAKTGAFSLEEEKASGAEDLLNLAAVETIRHGGEVFAVELQLAGVHELAAAVYRFSERVPPAPRMSGPRQMLPASNGTN